MAFPDKLISLGLNCATDYNKSKALSCSLGKSATTPDYRAFFLAVVK